MKSIQPTQIICDGILIDRPPNLIITLTSKNYLKSNLGVRVRVRVIVGVRVRARIRVRVRSRVGVRVRVRVRG